MGKPLRTAAILVAVVIALIAGGQTTAQAAWPTGLVAGSKGLAKSGAAPAAPTAPTASCTSRFSNTIKLTWTAVPNATSYRVYVSTQASSGPFTLVATGTTTPWTSAALGSGTYWYAVAANIGTNWQGAQSAASASHQITSFGWCN